ncbi:MAG: hypothetical protein ACO1NY_15165 [Pseudorhodoplanes sp.]
MIKLKLFLAIVIAVFTSAVATANDFPITELSKPQAPVNPRDVYGTVRYQIVDFRSQQRMLKLAQYLADLFSVREGEFILTLELKKPDDTVLVREPIAHFKVRSQRVLLIFPKSYEEMTRRNWAGQMLSEALVVHVGTNNLKVQVTAYNAEKSTIDWSVFNSLIQIANKANIELITLPVAAAEKAAWESIQKAISAVLDTYEKKEVTDLTTMSFTNMGAVFANAVNIKSPFQNIRQSGDIVTKVSFETLPTKIGSFNVSTKKFINPSVTAFAQATISGKVISEYLATQPSSSDFVKALASPAGYTDAAQTLLSRCTVVKQMMDNNFSNRDSTAVYWAWLSQNEVALKKNAAYKECLPSYLRDEFAILGLPHSALLQ